MHDTSAKMRGKDKEMEVHERNDERSARRHIELSCMPDMGHVVSRDKDLQCVLGTPQDTDTGRFAAS